METDRIAPKGDAITRTAAQRGLLGVGLVVLMALSAGAYVYWVWNASHEIANRPKSQPPAASSTAAPRVAESPARPSSAPAPAAAPAPTASPLAAATPAPAATSVSAATPVPAAAPTATPAPTATLAPATAPSAIAAAPIAAAPKSSAPPSESPVAAAEPAPSASLQQQPASLPREDVVFVQKPGVRMRSEPGRHGKVIGTPAKGSQFKIVGRAGSWVQVEGDAGRGWIGGRMLGPQSP